APAEVEVESSILDERCGAGAEVVLSDLELAAEISSPDLRALLEVERMQDAVRVERVDEPFLHDRAAARAAIVAVAIDVARRVREPPLPLAVLRVEAVDAVLVRDAVEEDQTVFRDDDAAIPRADPLLPELGRAARGPLLQ